MDAAAISRRIGAIAKSPLRPLTAVILLAAAAAAAPARGADRVLTWEECVALAQENNPDLAASARGLEASRASYLESFNGLLPKVGLSNSYSDSRFSDNLSRWGAQGSASLDLFNLGAVAGIRSAAAGLGQARAGRRLASASLRLSLRRAFAQLLYNQWIIGVSRGIRDLREKDAKLVAFRYESGRESRGNMLRAQAQLLAAEADLSQAGRDLRSARAGLNRHLGLDEFAVAAASGILEAPDAPPLPGDLRAIASARPEVASQEAAVAAAEAALLRARAAFFPTVAMSYSRSASGRGEFPAARYSWSFGGSLSLPLFGSGPTSAYLNSTAGMRSLERAREDLRSARNQASSELEAAWSAYAGAAEAAAVQQALRAAARQRNDEADVRYASGLLSFDNWELIVSDRVNSERQAVQSQLGAMQAEAAWHKALGLGLGE